MANILPFMILNEDQAAALREETQGDMHRLDPTLITNGPRAGKYALREGVKFEAVYEGRRDAFRMFPVDELDADTAFAVPEEE